MTNRREIVHTRRNVEDYDDPYISDEHLEDNTVCKKCGDVYMAGRWYAKDQIGEKRPTGEPVFLAQCPACAKQRDRFPEGIVRITGNFFLSHEDEVLNLIRNEVERAQSANPLERLVSIESSPEAIEVSTTNEKLAQRIGKALHKAYAGEIEYKWSGDTKLTRVNWHRDL